MDVGNINIMDIIGVTKVSERKILNDVTYVWNQKDTKLVKTESNDGY